MASFLSKTNRQILIALFISFETICIISSLKLTDLGEPVDCKSLYDQANKTITDLGSNWRDELEKMRKNYTEEITQCKQNLNTTEYPQVGEYLDYELNIFGDCSSSNTWQTVGIIFIIAFVLSTAGLAVVSVLYYKNLRRNI
uniref:Uncharacterized protein n=2 Tax=Meloidogyne incognita group TaxID=654580 RepID=A0A915N102_MELJA